MTIHDYLMTKFPHFDIIGAHAWCEEEDLHIRVRVLNDHAVIEVFCEHPYSCVTSTCDFNLECDIVDWLEENLDDMIQELNVL